MSLQALRDRQAATGSIAWTSIADLSVPDSFGNDAAAKQAAQTGVALYDRSHWGRILVAGADRLRFLHNQTTNAFQALQPGQGCDTVFVTSTARTIDLVSAYVLDDAVMLFTSPGYSTKLIEWMDRFIFFADKVELKDLTASTVAFTLLGDRSADLLRALEITTLSNLADRSHQLVTIAEMPVRIAVDSGLTMPGYTLITEIDRAVDLWEILATAGAVPLGDRVWQQLRVAQGRPAPGQELTDEINPLEAGLWQTISLSKGCYIGQETIARLHTYKGVKQQLWGLRLAAAADPGTIITHQDDKIGVLTSCEPIETGFLGLAYIRTKALEPIPETVQVGSIAATLEAVPFVSHVYP